ncbi:MAG: winged helix-turn-helix domain-containing protein [Bryobacteraceae bacterium]
MQVIQIATAGHSGQYEDARLAVHFTTERVLLDLKALKLTRLEYKLLAVLTQQAGEIVPRAALLMTVWGYGPDIRTRTLDVHIRRLRAKLGEYGRKHIETIFGSGYRLQPCRTQSLYSTIAAG